MCTLMKLSVLGGLFVPVVSRLLKLYEKRSCTVQIDRWVDYSSGITALTFIWSYRLQLHWVPLQRPLHDCNGQEKEATQCLVRSMSHL